MKLTVMGSPGKSNPSSLVAVDNIIIKMATNESRNVTNKGVEPETDFKSKVENEYYFVGQKIETRRKMFVLFLISYMKNFIFED